MQDSKNIVWTHIWHPHTQKTLICHGKDLRHLLLATNTFPFYDPFLFFVMYGKEKGLGEVRKLWLTENRRRIPRFQYVLVPVCAHTRMLTQSIFKMQETGSTTTCIRSLHQLPSLATLRHFLPPSGAKNHPHHPQEVLLELLQGARLNPLRLKSLKQRTGHSPDLGARGWQREGSEGRYAQGKESETWRDSTPALPSCSFLVLVWTGRSCRLLGVSSLLHPVPPFHSGSEHTGAGGVETRVRLGLGSRPGPRFALGDSTEVFFSCLTADSRQFREIRRRLHNRLAQKV